MPIVSIPAPYRGPTDGVASVEVAGTCVRECINAVEAKYPGFREQILDGDGQLHRFVRLFKNGEPLETFPLDAPVDAEDEIEVLAAIAGGVRR